MVNRALTRARGWFPFRDGALRPGCPSARGRCRQSGMFEETAAIVFKLTLAVLIMVPAW
jgi:hypothetical protein